MKYFLVILLAISPLTDLDKIAKINDIKKEAKAAYNNGNYQKAIKQYNYLLDSMKVEDESIVLNLANAYYQLNDSVSLASATQNYQTLTDSKDHELKSIAHQQLGVMADRAKKFEEALAHFKNAIKANPQNEDARYNYEMLKKMLDEQKKKEQEQNKDKNQQNKNQDNKDQQQKKDGDQNKDQQNKDQQKKDQQQKDQKSKDGDKKDQQNQQENKEGDKKDDQQKKEQEQQKNEEGKDGKEKKDQQPKPEDGEKSDKKGDQEQMQSISDKLKEMKISEEKAKMIMEALKNNEIQYIQQNKKKATKRKDPNKPDW